MFNTPQSLAIRQSAGVLFLTHFVCYNRRMAETLPRTALELSKEEWKAYRPIPAMRQRRSAALPKVERRRRQALRVARQAADMLRGSFGATRVVLFGSLTRHGEFTMWSDIDLAVFGIPADRFFAAVAAVTGISSVFRVDLVDAETCQVSLRAAVDREGKVL